MGQILNGNERGTWYDLFGDPKNDPAVVLVTGLGAQLAGGRGLGKICERSVDGQPELRFGRSSKVTTSSIRVRAWPPRSLPVAPPSCMRR
jgi:hypothetical protein